MANLLIELLTEELPPKLLARLGKTFAEGIESGLRSEGFLSPESQAKAFASPRRLGVWIDTVAAIQADKAVERKGPNKAASFDAAGEPTPALKGFARSCGVDISALATTQDAKGNEIFIYQSMEKGLGLATVLQTIVSEVLRQLPVHKVMHWGDRATAFVRPVHGLVCLYGDEVLDIEALGHRAGRTTLGHRFLSEGEISIPNADVYERLMQESGRVIANFDDRKALIESALKTQAGKDRLLAGDELLDEVTALVEWPVVYEGHFDEDFLQVPAECLTLSMKSHQKYFPVGTEDGTLLSRFLVVSNIETTDPKNIISGNERVLRARLSDARFFFEQDKKRPLSDRRAQLEAVVYHNKLGSVAKRIDRLAKLAAAIGQQLGTSADEARRAADLAKLDLVTDMVGEFPELQGIMGAYYARHDGEPESIVTAIREHYQPRFAGDLLPASPLGQVLSLADKIDTLVGIYGIGQIPTGDKDPFALRRQALGVIRILIECKLPLSLTELLTSAEAGFADGLLSADVSTKLHEFILERARHYLREQGHTNEAIEAVLAVSPDRLESIPERLTAVKTFMGQEAAVALSAANKRIRNILKKVGHDAALSIQPQLFEGDAEKNLYGAIEKLKSPVASAMAQQHYVEALTLLSGVRSEVDAFFNDVMVMAEDGALRNNRLGLLRALDQLMNQVADLSHLSGQ